MKILLLHLFSLKNAGDQAIFQTTLRMLDVAFPQAEIIVTLQDVRSALAVPANVHFIKGLLSWAVEFTPEGNVRVRRLAWAWYFLLTCFNAFAYRMTGNTPLGLFDVEKRRLIEAYSGADLVLASGGGYLYECRQHGLWFIGVAAELFLALLFRKPLVLLPQSIGPLPGREQQWLTRWIVEESQLVLLREPQSMAILQRIGAKGHFLLFPDLAFGQESSPRAAALTWLEQQGCRLQAKRPLIALTVINWAAQCSQFTEQQQTNFENVIVAVCNTVIKRGASIIVLPQSCGPLAGQDDRIVARRILSQLDAPEWFVIGQEQPVAAVLQAVCGECCLVIGTRMHSVIFGMNAGVPTIGIGYLHKTRGLFTWLGWERWYSDIVTLDTPQLLDLVTTLLEESPRYLPPLDQRVAELQTVLSHLPELLHSVLAETRRGGSTDDRHG